LEKSETEKKHAYEMLMRDLLRFLGTRPGELSEKTNWKDPPCYENGNTSTISTGPFSIVFSMFTRGYFDGFFPLKVPRGGSQQVEDCNSL